MCEIQIHILAPCTVSEWGLIENLFFELFVKESIERLQLKPRFMGLAESKLILLVEQETIVDQPEEVTRVFTGPHVTRVVPMRGSVRGINAPAYPEGRGDHLSGLKDHLAEANVIKIS